MIFFFFVCFGRFFCSQHQKRAFKFLILDIFWVNIQQSYHKITNWYIRVFASTCVNRNRHENKEKSPHSWHAYSLVVLCCCFVVNNSYSVHCAVDPKEARKYRIGLARKILVKILVYSIYINFDKLLVAFENDTEKNKQN